jgi:mono/diheme cytochrome c family protein
MSRLVLVAAGLGAVAALATTLVGAAAAAPAAPAAPRAAFIDNCSACHQPEGAGIQGVFPALAGNPFVKGDATELVRTILAGRNGMPSFKNDLSDEQVAAIVSHIRTSWGNGAAPVTPAFIAEVRRRTNNPQGQTRPNSN